ncbi:MAG: SUMF1/EgtB/PvdO family nonheme iron enzyme [bacterium]
MKSTDPPPPAPEPTDDAGTRPTGEPEGTPLALPIASVDPDDRYVELELIRAGGSSEVWRVRDRMLDRVVAMKRIAPGVSAEPAIAEARVAARLQHPGVLPIYEVGHTARGERWLTMREVAGQDLDRVLADARRGDGAWSRRRLVDVFARICEPMAYAHAQGIVHRDLKPANVRVGAFGDVIVLDWGIARPIGAPGDRAGTPSWCPPEQAAGAPVDPRADVYMLGQILRRILDATPGEGRDDTLDALVARAVDPDPARRPSDAAALLDPVTAWLDGARRRAEARELVAEARVMRPEIEALIAAARADERAAAALLDPIAPNAPVAEKRAAWALEDRARAQRAKALRRQLDFEQRLQAARRRADDLAEARVMLADYYRERLDAAEAARDVDTAAEYETRLRDVDDGRHAAWLDGDGAVTVITDPPGAEVWCARYETHERRLVAGAERWLGRTPLVDAPLARGDWQLRVTLPGHHAVIHPVQIERGGRWDGVAPGDRAPTPIVLPPLGELDADERYVPPGWCWTGGDRQAADGLPRRRLWVDGFVMQRRPLTWRGLVATLDEMVAAGDDALAERIPPPADGPDEGFLRVERTAAGGYRVVSLDPARVVDDWPVVRIDWYGACALAAWRARRSGRPWRLPHDIEREKAARGVDGRWLPWGDFFDHTWANVLDSRSDRPRPGPVDEFPTDVSPYGIEGLIGNTRDWCLNGYRRDGLPPDAQRLIVTAAPTDDTPRVLRGGGWGSRADVARAASRYADRPDRRLSMVGVRLVRPWPPR